MAATLAPPFHAYVGPHMSERQKAQFWFKAPLAEAEPKLRKAALRTKEPLSRVTWVWLQVQRSAQELDSGGGFEVDRAELALLDRVDEETIDRVLLAFEAPDVALIVDGRCATFKEKQLSRDQRHRANKPRKGRTAPADETSDARDAQDADSDPPATREAPSASRSGIESSESSSSDDGRIIEIPPSGVVVESPTREMTTTTGAEILNAFSEVDQARIPPDVLRKGLPTIQAWLADRCDLRLVVAPTLADIAAHLSAPLRGLRVPWVAREILAHRDRRLALASAPRASPATTDPRNFATDLQPNSARGGVKDYEAELLKMKAQGYA